MTLARIPSRRPVALAAALASAALWALAPAAQAQSEGGGDLSPRLAELARPSVAAAPDAAQARALDLAVDGPGSLLGSGERILVDVRFERGAAAGREAVLATGARIVHLSRRYQTATVAAEPADLRAIAAAPRVAGVTEVLEPMVSAECAGSVTSEGDTLLSAFAARSDFAVDGSEVTVGILSDSFDRDLTAPTHAADDVASGDLPGPGNPCERTTPVDVLFDPLASAEASDEGRGMAQIVHDLAPGAEISFATAFEGELEFAEAIELLAEEGAGVIVDDISYFAEPFFQDGPVAVAINNVVADGSSYFSAAGNDNLIIGGDNVASWETPEFRETADCPLLLEAITPAERCLDFNPGAGEDNTFGLTVDAEETLLVDLQWAQPWNGVVNDIDLYLLDGTGAPLAPLGGTSDNVGGSQKPTEILQWENLTPLPKEVQLVIDRCFSSEKEAEEEKGCNPSPKIVKAAKPRIKFALLQNGGGVSATEYPKSSGGDVVGPTVFGHAGAASAIATAAVNAGSGKLETYSSRGPVTHLFGPVSGVAPAPPIVPQTIAKPDLAAIDCNRTSFFATETSPGIFRFCGTSAAAPHAAAVAALLGEANPSLTPAETLAALKTTASPVAGAGPDGVGAGLVNAHAALGGSILPPEIEITEEPDEVSQDRTPTIAFEANRPVAFSCALDAGPFFPCTSPFTPAEPFEDGLHGFVARGIDIAGRIGTSETVLFTVDTTPPRTIIRTHPRKRIRTRTRRARAVFGFASNEREVSFTCRVDGGLFRFCPATLARRFKAGRHAVRARAVDEAGNVDPTPAVFRFRVKRVRRPSGR